MLALLACVAFMGRPFEAMPSQRKHPSVRHAEAEASEARRLVQVAEEEKLNTLRHRKSTYQELKEVKRELKEAQPATMAGKSREVKRIRPGTSTFYTHVEFGVNWLSRFHIHDVPMLLVACMKTLGKKKETDLRRETMMDSGMDSTRKKLLHEHEKKIAEHLEKKVYTPDHFSLLRLIIGMSKRACGLIEQSLKYAHHSDGTRTRQTLCPGSTVYAPTIFGLDSINASEERALKESNFELNQHAGKQGADICGKVRRAAIVVTHAMP